MYRYQCDKIGILTDGSQRSLFSQQRERPSGEPSKAEHLSRLLRLVLMTVGMEEHLEGLTLGEQLEPPSADEVLSYTSPTPGAHACSAPCVVCVGWTCVLGRGGPI